MDSKRNTPAEDALEALVPLQCQYCGVGCRELIEHKTFLRRVDGIVACTGCFYHHHGKTAIPSHRLNKPHEYWEGYWRDAGKNDDNEP